jgi:hypothetical protein
MLKFKKPDTGNAVTWGFIGLFSTLVCTVLGVWMKDLTILFVAAWVCSLLPIINFTNGTSPALAKVAIRIVIVVLIALGLFALTLHYRPKPDVPRVLPTISWFPAPIVEGEPITSEQLDAHAYNGEDAVEGSYLYSDPIGSTLPTGHPPIHVTFTPSDAIRFDVAEKSVTVLVTPRVVHAPVGHVVSLAERTQQLASDILSDEVVRVRLSRDWWEDHETYKEKFTGSDNQFDMEFATRVIGIFSELDHDGVDTTKARENFKNHEVLYLGFDLEAFARSLQKSANRSLSSEDKKFLVDRFGLNSGGEHNQQLGLDRDSTMRVFADPTCAECMRFADEIRICAKEAKWKVNESVEPLLVSDNPGIVVEGNADGLGGEPGLWLSKMGFAVRNNFSKNIPTNPMEVHIIVAREKIKQQTAR